MIKLKNPFTDLSAKTGNGRINVLIPAAVAIVFLYIAAMDLVFFRFMLLLFTFSLVILVFLLCKRVNHLLDKFPLDEANDEALEAQNSHDRFHHESRQEIAYDRKHEATGEAFHPFETDEKQVLEELFDKARLKEEEKEAYRKVIRGDAAEVSHIKQELLVLKNEIQQVVKEKTNLLLKRDHDREQVVRLLQPEFIIDSSFEELNQKFEMMRHQLSPEVVQSLKESNYIDEDFKFTRIGYRELIKTAKKVH
ncbi:hypothetical protein ACFOU2_08360 [Bacillus songklensis]|uniref:Uncharacterized protein n=1 Tax=Bacillus songklensis TaxID=1069116 RepID=A0ABV8AZV4_9BACI